MKSRLLENITNFIQGYKNAFEEMFNCEDFFFIKVIIVFLFLFMGPLTLLSFAVLLIWLLLQYPLLVLFLCALVGAILGVTRLLDTYYKNVKKK